MGITAGKFLPCPGGLWLVLGTAAVVTAFFWKQSLYCYLALICLGAVSIQGVCRLPPNHIALNSLPQCRQIQSMEGMADSEPDVQIWAQGRRQVFDFAFQRVLINGAWVPKQGKLRVELYQNKNIHYGQCLHLSGSIHPIFEFGNKKFSYRQYMRDRGIYWAMSVNKDKACDILKENCGNVFMATAIRVRRKCGGIFARYLGVGQAGMITAMVLGDRSNMPADLKAVFVNTGTAHILAISGMNMAIIAAMAFFILKLCGLPRIWQWLISIIFLFAYAFLSGWSASVVRACLMTSIFLASFALENEGDPLNSLGLAAVILLLMDPRNLFDVGFQLSFAAVLAILILYAPCKKVFQWLPNVLAKPLAVSLAAWAGTAGIIAAHFGMVTPVSIIANIPIVPLADLVMALGLGLIAAGACLPLLAYPFAACLQAVFSTMVILASWFSQIPWGHFSFN